MGGSFTVKESKILTPLISDCVNFGLGEKEALAYIHARLGRQISAEAYYRRKKLIDSGRHAKEWLSYYSRVGFLVTHKKIIDVIETMQQDTLKDYLIEQSKPYTQKDMELVQKLRYEIRENCKLIQELSLGTPIIAQIKSKIEHAELLQEGK